MWCHLREAHEWREPERRFERTVERRRRWQRNFNYRPKFLLLALLFIGEFLLTQQLLSTFSCCIFLYYARTSYVGA